MRKLVYGKYVGKVSYWENGLHNDRPLQTSRAEPFDNSTSPIVITSKVLGQGLEYGMIPKSYQTNNEGTEVADVDEESSSESDSVLSRMPHFLNQKYLGGSGVINMDVLSLEPNLLTRKESSHPEKLLFDTVSLDTTPPKKTIRRRIKTLKRFFKHKK